MGKQRQGERLKAVGSPETCCWGCERCLAEVCLLTTFPFHSRRFFFSFFQGPGHSHWSYEGKYPALTPAFFPTTQQSLGRSQQWLMITGLLRVLLSSPFPPA